MEEITLFYATNNKSKLHNMHYRLRNYPIKVVCPDDLNIHIEIDECGKTAIENAMIKAKAYFSVTNLPTIAGDCGMWIDGVCEEKQPGLYVRRVNGKTLSDEEMIEYYAKLANEAPGECIIHYVTGIALITRSGEYTKEIMDHSLKLSSIPNTNRVHRGNPLDVISLVEDGRYYNDLTDEERVVLESVGEQQFTDFIVNNVRI